MMSLTPLYALLIEQRWTDLILQKAGTPQMRLKKKRQPFSILLLIPWKIFLMNKGRLVSVMASSGQYFVITEIRNVYFVFHDDIAKHHLFSTTLNFWFNYSRYPHKYILYAASDHNKVATEMDLLISDIVKIIDDSLRKTYWSVSPSLCQNELWTRRWWSWVILLCMGHGSPS